MSFCREEQIDQFNPSVKSVITFLTKLLKDGLGYSGINTAKSAVSSVVSIVNNRNIGNNSLIKQFMKGVFNQKPCLPRLGSTWAVSDVLKYLKSLSPVTDLSLKLLSYKLVMLLALTTGQRLQTLHAMDIRNIVFSEDSIKIRIGNLLKQSRVGNHLHEIYIESYKLDEDVCVVKTLGVYLSKTESLRGDETQMFIALQKPYKPVTKSTLGRWIKSVLLGAGIDMTMYTPHSTRAASTSLAAGKVPIDTVLKTAGWKKDCVFRKFYKREVTNNAAFSNAVLSESQQ